jgi:hypothetical protein
MLCCQKLVWCYVRPRFTTKGSRGKGTPLISKLPGPLRSHNAATIPVSTHYMPSQFGGSLFYNIILATLHGRRPSWPIILNTVELGMPSSFAIARPVFPNKGQEVKGKGTHALKQWFTRVRRRPSERSSKPSLSLDPRALDYSAPQNIEHTSRREPKLLRNFPTTHSRCPQPSHFAAMHIKDARSSKLDSTSLCSSHPMSCAFCRDCSLGFENAVHRVQECLSGCGIDDAQARNDQGNAAVRKLANHAGTEGF